MRKVLEIQAFLEYSMVVTKRYGRFLPVPCACNLRCSKLKQRRFGTMDRFLHPIFRPSCCRNFTFTLALSWIIGLLNGLLFSLSADTLLSSTMRIAINGGMSISGLLTALLLPFLFSAFAVFISQLWLLIPIAFVKAFLFSFTGLGVLLTFGSAGWLICLLFMFAESLAMPILWWYWLRVSGDSGRTVFHNCFPAVLCVGLVGCIDQWIVAPFLACLI